MDCQGVDWEGKDGEHGDDAEAEEGPLRAYGKSVAATDDFMVFDRRPRAVPSAAFSELRRRLVENYAWLHANGRLSHPRARAQ